jgi:hypothetical protein
MELTLVYNVPASQHHAPIRRGSYEDDLTQLNAYDYKACDDFCTRPTRTHISLDLRAGVFSVKNKDGVTNRQVFEAVAKHWDGPASFSLGDHCFWNGFEEVAELVDGGLALDAAHYDS